MDPAGHRPKPTLSLKKIAKELGVSVMTVSYALRPLKEGERPLCSEKTAERIRQAAEKLGYVTNRISRGIRTRKSGVVAFVEPHLSVGMKDGTDPILPLHTHPFLTGLSQALALEGLHVALVAMDEVQATKSGQLLSMLRERFFDGLVVQYGLSLEARQMIEESQMPVIYWDAGLFDESNCVNRNEFEVGTKVTRRLIELGHTRIAFAVGRGSWQLYQAGEPVHYSYAHRYEGFVAAMRERGLRPLIVKGYDPDELAAQIKKDGITGLITIARQPVLVMKIASRLGKTIPDDLSVLVCDLDPRMSITADIPGGAIYDRYQVGTKVAGLLLRRIATNGAPVPSVCIPVDEVVDGDNAGRAPGI